MNKEKKINPRSKKPTCTCTLTFESLEDYREMEDWLTREGRKVGPYLLYLARREKEKEEGRFSTCQVDLDVIRRKQEQIRVGT